MIFEHFTYNSYGKYFCIGKLKAYEAGYRAWQVSLGICKASKHVW